MENLEKKVTELQKYIHELERDLIHDGLTSLKTRTFFEEELKLYLSVISSADKGKRREWFGFKNISILFFDIDNFKNINDTNGHDAGDVVLREVAQTIARSVREGDSVARWGGEEVVALLLGANEVDAKEKAEIIRGKIETLSFDSYPNLKVTISIGITHSVGGVTCEELVNQADKALYKAKEIGKNKVVMYSELVS